jgi:hypothetical protein
MFRAQCYRKNCFYTYITERINYKPISNPIPAEALNHALSDPIYDKILEKILYISSNYKLRSSKASKK